MFKNSLTFTQSHILSKKEKKEIISSLLNNIIYDKRIINYISNNFKEIIIKKANISNKKRNIIFYENNPIFFEYEKDSYYPTLFILQYFNMDIGKNLIKNFCLIYTDTTKFIINGADLMLKGIINRNLFNNINFNLGDLFYVQTEKGEIVAIGTCLMSSNTINLNSPSGKFLKILHKKEDSLYNLGNENSIKIIEIPEIMEEIKKEKEEIIKKFEEENIKKQDDNNENNVLNEENINNNIENIEVNNNNNNNIIISSNNKDDNNYNSNNEKEDDSNNINENIDNQNNNNDNIINEQNIEIPNKEEIDNNLITIFLTLCKLHLKNETFPMDPGKLYSSFMKPLSEELKINIDIKLSSFKKVNDFFKFLSKEKKLIVFNKAKGQNNDYILQINFESDLIKEFKPNIKKIKFLSNHKNLLENNTNNNLLLSKDEKIEVVIKYRPNQKLQNIFSIYIKDFDTSKYYSLKECKEVLTNYLKEHNLFLPNSTVKLDDYLEKILSIHHKEFNIDGYTYNISEIIEMWERNLNQKSIVIKTNLINQTQEEVKTNNLKIRIISKKINNKNVTLVSGLENFIDVKEACKNLAKHFASSVAIKDEVSGLKNVVLIQGHWVNELVEKLINEFKINKKIIKIEDRLKNKKK